MWDHPVSIQQAIHILVLSCPFPLHWPFSSYWQNSLCSEGYPYTPPSDSFFGAAGLHECSMVFLNVSLLSLWFQQTSSLAVLAARLGTLPLRSIGTLHNEQTWVICPWPALIHVHKAVQLSMCNNSNAAQILSMDPLLRPCDPIKIDWMGWSSEKGLQTSAKQEYTE